MLAILRKWLTPTPKPDTHIVVVEPSMFRTEDTYILGPFPLWKAKWIARRECAKHPYSEVLVTSRYATVYRGNRVLRAGDPA